MSHEPTPRDGARAAVDPVGSPTSTRTPLGVMSSSNFNCASPSQAKRTLETQLADTERRIQDASRLGTALLDQKQELVDRLKEIVAERDGDEIGPDLRQKLVELERDYNEVGQETARVLVPRSRKISQETLDVTSMWAHGSSNEGRSSLTKPNSLSHKPSNLFAGRVHDIQFATDISASLLGQVRSLQALLAERDETVKALNQEKADIQSEVETLGQKVRGLDDSEQRQRDENWSLETQVQDLLSQLKESQSREQKLNQSLGLARTERTNSEKELDDVKHVHNKLNEEYDKLQKQHDTEATGLRRTLAAAYLERDDLLHKVSELTSHNTDLAHAITSNSQAHQPALGQDQAAVPPVREADQSSSEYSPPPSPSKNTPRPGALESETLRSSLHHAHRMIQNLKTNIHREKTDKLELKRLLQDARDEVEMRRTDGSQLNGTLKKRKVAEASRKNGRPSKLGTAKLPREESINDSIWEDQEENGSKTISSPFQLHSDQQQEPSDAFETANERDSTTETETFHTGAESLAGDSTDELTETEDSHTSRSRPPLAQSRNRTSFLSTASDEEEDVDKETPQRQSKYKIRITRNGVRRELGSPQSMQDSPASFQSNDSVTQMTQTLAAELEDLDDASTANSTPTRPSTTTATHIAEAKQGTYQEAENEIHSDIRDATPPQKRGDDQSFSGNNTVDTPSSTASLTAGKLANTVRGLFGVRNSSDIKSGNSAHHPVPQEHAMSRTEPGFSASLSLSAIISQQTAPLDVVESSSFKVIPPMSRNNSVEGRATLATSTGHIYSSTGSNHNDSDTIVGQRGQRTPPERSEVDESAQTLVPAGSIRNPNSELTTSSPTLSSGSPNPKDPTNRNLPYVSAASRRIEGSPMRANNMQKRPLSSGSVRKATTPPLPVDHKEAIAAAAKTNQAPGSASTAGIAAPAPKAQPFSARPRTPASSKQSPNVNKTSTATPRWTAPVSTSRRSSVSSFVSELDERLDTGNSRSAQFFDGFEMRNADPRMIQAITQTMIGEFLWKYTRKAGRGDHSDNRHRRFFWIHPYTRTLYWSNQDPSNTGRSELKAKSVGIEAVRVVSDENPMPPGLHPKSIIVVTPGRNIKFTAPTSQRHETWFNALSYLLLRTGIERQDDAGLQLRHYGSQSNFASKHINRNNSMQLRSSEDFLDVSARDTPSPSASAFTSHQPYPSVGQGESVATHVRTDPHPLTYGLERPETFKRPSLPSTSTAVMRNSRMTRPGSIASRLRPESGLFSLKRESTSRNSYSAATSASQSGRQSRSESLERRAERSSLENVRACCDGKHDVGSLTHRPSRHTSISSRTGHHRHQTPSATSSVQHLPQDPAGFTS